MLLVDIPIGYYDSPKRLIQKINKAIPTSSIEFVYEEYEPVTIKLDKDIESL